MKIALFCPNYPPAVSEGGISHYTRCLARHLCQAGDDVYVIAGKAYCGSGVDGKASVFKYPGLWNLSTLRRISQQLRAHNIKLINLQYSPVMYPWQFKLAWNYLSKRFITTVSFHTLWGGRKINHFLALNLLYGADGVIATNSEIVHLLKKYMPCFLKKTRYIPIGSNIQPKQADQNEYQKIMAGFSTDSDTPLLAYFGMAYPGKGLQMLFEAVHILLLKQDIDFKLIVIGGGIADLSEYIREKKKLVQSFGIQDRVIFTGKIPAGEVSVLLNASRMVVLPFVSGVSDRRGSLMAALAHHKAVVTTKPAVSIDGFKNRENLIWPNETNAKNLADTIRQVFEDRELRQKLEKGAKALSRSYLWADISKETRQFFQTVVGKNVKPNFIDCDNEAALR